MRLARFASLVFLAVLVAIPASAITYGFVDSNNTYSNVGAFVVQSPSGDNYVICSGTLIAPNVFLTASHCTAFYEQDLAPLGYTAYVSFDKTVPVGELSTNKTKLYAVTDVVTNPNYNQSQSDSGDIGVLILATSPRGIKPATLPTCGFFDTLSAKQLDALVFTNAGYGLQERVVGGGTPIFQDSNPINRMYSFSSFNSLNGGYIRLSQNPSTGNGGTCFGDSGGPNFFTYKGQLILGAITITGDSVCRSTNVDYRLDTQPVSDFFSYVNATYGTAIPVPCP